MNGDRVERFLNSLDRESATRKMELATQRSLLTIANESQKAVLRRSGVLLLYAHWEGFVRKSVKEYLRLFAGNQISTAPKHLKSAALFHYLHSKQLKNLDLRLSKAALDYIVDESSRVNQKIDEIASTKSNLNYKQLETIWGLIESSDSEFSTRFSTKEVFIDRVLLHSRNGIAHGELLPVQEDDFDELHDKTMELMDSFKDAIVNSARTHCI